MSIATQIAMDWTERGWVPDVLVRKGIRQLIKSRLEEIDIDDCETMMANESRFVEYMNRSEIAPLPHKANEQHYEVPPEFFDLVLGHRRKYSSCFWPAGVNNLDAAEDAALAKTCARAGIADGMKILELGCGWGSLTLWVAERYPDAEIVGVSNSEPQRRFIEEEVARRRVANVRIITADMNDFSIEDRFDRVVSVEMFEHMRNYRDMFSRVHDWLLPDGRFFMHIFCHRSAPYAFVDNDESDWMSRHFFSGGIMPSEDLPLRFQEHLKLVDMWRWAGTHYARTAEAWLVNMEAKRETVWPILESTYGGEDAARWWVRWRLFFMACAELFGYRRGQQWWVSHYLFERS
jgi:cyclopropane-fatty-acyl-phospholipid synthase